MKARAAPNAALLGILPALLIALPAVTADANAIAKAELAKAAMIGKIARFIEWPAPLPPRFALCVSTEHPQLAAVQAYYKSVAIADRPVEVRVLERAGAIAGCQVAFLAPRDVAHLSHLRANAGRERVLLVAEGPEAARSGVHVAFYSDMNRLRLEVNRKALEASGLKVSYRLLEVAKVVD